MAIDLTKPLRRKSDKRRVLDSHLFKLGTFPLCVIFDGEDPEFLTGFSANGLGDYDGNGEQLENVPEPLVRFINVYKDGFGALVCESRAGADSESSANRLACVKMTYDTETNTATAEVL